MTLDGRFRLSSRSLASERDRIHYAETIQIWLRARSLCASAALGFSVANARHEWTGGSKRNLRDSSASDNVDVYDVLPISFRRLLKLRAFKKCSQKARKDQINWLRGLTILWSNRSFDGDGALRLRCASELLLQLAKRLVVDQPQRLERISLVFEEKEEQRTQGFILQWSSNGGDSFQEIVRQQLNFSPPHT